MRIDDSTRHTFVTAAMFDFVDLDLCDIALDKRGIPSSASDIVYGAAAFISGNVNGSLKVLLLSMVSPVGVDSSFADCVGKRD